MATAQEAGRPQPQTTVESSGGGPFVRYSQPGRAPLYQRTGDALNGIITQPLVARPGYMRNVRVTNQLVTGGALTTGVNQPDAPYNLHSLIQFKDAFGTPLLVAPGWEIAFLLSIIGGHFGLDNQSNLPSALPSFSALSNTTGAGKFSFSLPLEFAKAYGVLSAANASLLPTLQFNLNSVTALFGGSVTGTPPTVTSIIDTDFYWLPEGTADENGMAVEPPGLGTTRQWLLQQANPTVGASASSRIQFPRLGGYLDTIAWIFRDNTGARTDGYWPTRLQMYVDGVPLIDTDVANQLADDWFIQFGGVARPTGTYAVTRKNSLNQKSMGLLDSGEVYLSTNPGTLIELNGAPWGAGSNSPATANVLVGQIVPTGSIVQGLPEV
jgi:hypothetical protein